MALLCVIVLADRSTPAATVGLFYVIPVVIATVGAGGFAGLLFAVAGSLLWWANNPASNDLRFVLSSPYIALVQFVISMFAVLVVSGLRRAMAWEAKLARYDSLSGLSNRRRLFELAEVEVVRARRTGEPLSMVYFDVDDFKAVNDRFGHAAGDALIEVMGRALSTSSRAVDVAARVGGDEFVLLLPNTDPDGARVVLSKVRERFLDEVERNGWPAGLSAGVVSYEQPPVSAQEMMQRADEILYRAKQERVTL